jgi:quinol-cytochrome oxidoreductase complex cytochrome b subunit
MRETSYQISKHPKDSAPFAFRLWILSGQGQNEVAEEEEEEEEDTSRSSRPVGPTYMLMLVVSLGQSVPCQ